MVKGKVTVTMVALAMAAINTTTALPRGTTTMQGFHFGVLKDFAEKDPPNSCRFMYTQGAKFSFPRTISHLDVH